MDGAYVYDAVRLPRGRVRSSGGTLAGIAPHEMLAQLLTALSRRGAPVDLIDDVVAGVSTAAGDQAGDVTRVAIQAAGWPAHIPGGVVSRLCCSGLDAIAHGSAAVAAGAARMVVAGGVESMSRVPMLSDRPTFAVDDELGDLTGFVTIGVSADLTAAQFGIDRPELDAFAVRSHRRAAAAPTSMSVVPVRVDGADVLTNDEGARPDSALEDFAALPPLFADDPAWSRIDRIAPDLLRPAGGLHTIATAPQLADGASAALLGSRSMADAYGHAPRAQIIATVRTAVRSPLLTATVTRPVER